ncbi:YraN family protein [Sneathiella sp.]|uniref:YraN family protein n=1 Tax=Sneathiella sp. TaxID=1964365 RepID=UPI003568EDFC
MSKDALKRKRRRAYFRGKAAEFMATNYLRLKGYHIVANGYRKPFGEIDIVARRNNLLIAVEVKSRHRMSDAAEAISTKQKRRIGRALEAFVMERPKFNGFNLRFDVLLIVSFWQKPTHIEGAWE